MDELLLQRIANALERIAAALENNRHSEEYNLYDQLEAITAHMQTLADCMESLDEGTTHPKSP